MPKAKMSRRPLTRVRCPICGQEVASRVPRGGDGSARHPVLHNGQDGKPCDGRYHDVLHDAVVASGWS